MPEEALKLVDNDDQFTDVEQLIVVKHLPVIENQLKKLKPQIQKMVDDALALEVTEDTVKEIKKVRAELNKRFKALETRRAQIRDAVSAPYEAFMQVYKDCVKDPFYAADISLGSGIKSVEDGVKQNKESEIRAYFAEYAASVGYPKMAYERANINVTLSASMKSLKEQASAFIDRVASEIGIINEMDHSDEIMVEYNKSLMLKNAIDTVKERHKALEEAAKRREEEMRIQAEKEAAASKIEEAAKAAAPEIEHAPVVSETPEPEPAKTAATNVINLDEILTASFTVTATRGKLRALKQFLTEGGYDFE